MKKLIFLNIAGILTLVHFAKSQTTPRNRLLTTIYSFESVDETINQINLYSFYLNGITYQRTITENLHAAFNIKVKHKHLNDKLIA